MRRLAVLLACLLLAVLVLGQTPRAAQAGDIFGFRDSTAQREWEQKFLAVPDAAAAGEHLRILTAEPHLAGTPGGRKVAEYIASKFREYGFETEIVEYRVWMNHPKSIRVETLTPSGNTFIGPNPEQVEGDAFQSDPRVVAALNGFSPSGTVEAEAVYANYGRPEDFDKLAEMKVDVRGKIVITRYGQNFRGVKAYVAQERGAAGLIIYSDPIDDGYFKGDAYPRGPWRPPSGVQRGSILYMFKYPGDPTTPGIAATPSLPESERTAPKDAASLPAIPTTPLSYADAEKIMRTMRGPESPREWQGALPFTYHVGPGVKVRLALEHEYAYRPIFNVIGKLRGADLADELVTGGNHHDAWVYGAVDPNSGTATLLEAARGLGALVQQGWRPRRTIVLAAWDAEEQGLIGSTEWVEGNARELANAVAYFNVDSAVSGPDFGASAVPSLKQFVRDVAKAVSSPKGGTVYDVWRAQKEKERRERRTQLTPPEPEYEPQVKTRDVPVGDLGSGSDYTPFLQHLGVPATDMGSGGPYGVYHSVFDNFQWFRQNADPEFRYLQQMARVYGLQVLRLADADILPFDYENYGREIAEYVGQAQKKADTKFGRGVLDLRPALDAAHRLQESGRRMGKAQRDPRVSPAALNRALRDAERAFLIPEGLPGRPWFRHAIYAPGVYTGYAAVVLPGVNEAITAGDRERARTQLAALTAAIQRAAQALDAASPRRGAAATE
jgi:N-acetylated-alpha-linked acidic dipeptidase